MTSFDTGDELVLAAKVRIIQIVNSAILAGPLGFLVLILAMGPVGAPGNGLRSDWVVGVAIVASLSAVLLHCFLPRVITSQGRRRLAGRREVEGRAAGDTLALAELYINQKIVGIALLEGAAFFLLVLYWVDGRPFVILLALGLLATLAIQFPTRTRVSDWFELQRALLQEDRLAGGAM